MVARKDLEQAEADAARAQAEVDRAQARTRLYGSSAGVNQQLGLRTDIAGTVVERNLNPGQEVRPDNVTTPLFTVSDPGSLWVLIDAQEADLRDLRPGASIALVIPSLDQQSVQATVQGQFGFEPIELPPVTLVLPPSDLAAQLQGADTLIAGEQAELRLDAASQACVQALRLSQGEQVLARSSAEAPGRLAIDHQRQHTAGMFQRLIAAETGCLQLASDLINGRLQRQIDADGRRLGPLALGLHGRLKAGQIHRKAVLLGDLLGELQREAVGVIQLEGLLTGDLLGLGR